MVDRKPFGLLANRCGNLDRDRWSRPPDGYAFVQFDGLDIGIDFAEAACRALGVE